MVWPYSLDEAANFGIDYYYFFFLTILQQEVPFTIVVDTFDNKKIQCEKSIGKNECTYMPSELLELNFSMIIVSFFDYGQLF